MADTGRRQFVKFNFFKVASEWRRLSDDERLDSKREFAAVVEEAASSIFTRAFSLIGLRGDADFLLWQAAILSKTCSSRPRSCGALVWGRT